MGQKASLDDARDPLRPPSAYSTNITALAKPTTGVTDPINDLSGQVIACTAPFLECQFVGTNAANEDYTFEIWRWRAAQAKPDRTAASATNRGAGGGKEFDSASTACYSGSKMFAGTATLSAYVGVDGSDVENEIFYADTITLSFINPIMANKYDLYSPIDDTPGILMFDALAGSFYQFVFDLDAGSTTSASAGVLVGCFGGGG